MKRLISIGSLLTLIGGVAVLGWRLAQPSENRPLPTERFEVGATRDVRFQFSAESLDGFTDDMVEEQLRDWLLYSVLAESTGNAAALRDSLYDLPPTRASYVSAVAAFDFGPVRFRILDALG